MIRKGLNLASQFRSHTFYLWACTLSWWLIYSTKYYASPGEFIIEVGWGYQLNTTEHANVKYSSLTTIAIMVKSTKIVEGYGSIQKSNCWTKPAGIIDKNLMKLEIGAYAYPSNIVVKCLHGEYIREGLQIVKGQFDFWILHNLVLFLWISPS